MILQLRRLACCIVHNFNKVSSKFEKKTLRRFSEKSPEISPVFIIGLPRSGTTLIYQLLLNYYDWSYFPSTMQYFYGIPVTAYRIQRLLFPEPKYFSYVSEYGVFKEHNYLIKPWLPVEGHQIWHRWLQEALTHYPEKGLSITDIEEMRATIAGFVTISGKPFLNKNPRHSIRLLFLSEAFPKALFIVIKRKSLYVAQSLYIARIRAQEKNPHWNWWGTMPREYPHLKHLDPLRQSVGQTKALELALDTQLLSCNNRYIEIAYEDICEKPSEVLYGIQKFCLENGVQLRRIKNEVPTPFPLGEERKVPEVEFDQLRELLESTWRF